MRTVWIIETFHKGNWVPTWIQIANRNEGRYQLKRLSDQKVCRYRLVQYVRKESPVKKGLPIKSCTDCGSYGDEKECNRRTKQVENAMNDLGKYADCWHPKGKSK